MFFSFGMADSDVFLLCEGKIFFRQCRLLEHIVAIKDETERIWKEAAFF
jgi:hypothetical protein